MTTIHAHEVLHLLLDTETPYTEETLAQTVRNKYGADVRFYTCSQQDLTLDALLTFLLERRKVLRDGEFLTANRERMCNH